MPFLPRSHAVPSIVVGIVAILFRIGILHWSGGGYLTSDSVEYHNLAVNMVLGNGYSKALTTPYEPSFFREPGYPLFLAAIYWAFGFVDPPTHFAVGSDSMNQHTEMRVVQYVQALVGGLSLAIFYLTLVIVLPSRAAWIISIMAALYSPLAVFSTLLLRETLLTLVILLSNYFFARFLQDHKTVWLVAFSVGIGVSALILKITLLSPILVFFMLWFIRRDILLSIKCSILTAVVLLAVISPWLYRTYLFYPDWRIIRSMGTSHTVELRNYYLGLRHNVETGAMDSTTFSNRFLEWKSMSDRERFAFSFDGTLDEMTRSLKPPSWGQTLSMALQRWRLGWVESLWVVIQEDGWYHLRPHSYYLRRGQSAWFVISLLGLGFGHLAIVGMWVYFRRVHMVLFAFIYFYLLFYVVSNDTRRTLPVHLFVFMFSCMAVAHLYHKLMGRNQAKENSGTTMNGRALRPDTSTSGLQ